MKGDTMNNSKDKALFDFADANERLNQKEKQKRNREMKTKHKKRKREIENKRNKWREPTDLV